MEERWKVKIDGLEAPRLKWLNSGWFWAGAMGVEEKLRRMLVFKAMWLCIRHSSTERHDVKENLTWQKSVWRLIFVLFKEAPSSSRVDLFCLANNYSFIFCVKYILTCKMGWNSHEQTTWKELFLGKQMWVQLQMLSIKIKCLKTGK